MVLWFRDAWRGRLPLWVTYWVLGVGGNMSFLGVLIVIYLVGGAEAAIWRALG